MLLIAKEQLHVTQTSAENIRTLQRELTFQNPQFHKMQRMGFSTWNTPRDYKCYEKSDGGIIIPRGTGKRARALAEISGEPFRWRDERTSHNPIDVKLVDEINPFWYQTPALKSMVCEQQGLIEAPCSAGKTIICIAFIANISHGTMIVVHTSELFKQWVDEIREKLVGNFTLGQLGLGKRSIGDITIAMIQTLVKLTPKEWQKLNEKAVVTLWDESHHAGAETYVASIKKVRAKYILGVTATPKRKDKKDFLIHSYMGPIIHTITDEQLALSGRTVTCRVRVQNTGRKINFTKINDNYGKFSSLVANDVIRNELIVNNIQEDINDGRVPVVLTERRFHAKLLTSKLRANGITFGEIVGHVPSEVRTRVKDQMKRGMLQTMVINKQIGAEGLDMPILDSVHIAFHTTNQSLLKQIIGRGRRSYEGKEYCRVWLYRDFVYQVKFDERSFMEVEQEVATFKYSWSKTIKWLESQGFDVRFIDEPSMGVTA